MQGIINTGAAEFANGLDTAFQGIGDTMAAVGPDVQQMAHDLGVLAGGAIKTIIEKGKELYDQVKPVFDDIGKTLSDILPPGQDVADLFKGALGAAIDAVTFQFKVWAVGVDIVIHAFDELKKFVTPVIDTIRAGIKTIIDGFASIPSPWQDQAKAAQALWETNEKVEQSYKNAGGALGSFADQTGNASAGFGKLSTDAKAAGDEAKLAAGNADTAWRGVGDSVNATAQTASAGFGSLSAGAKGAADDLATSSAGGGSAWDANMGQLPASTQAAMTGVTGALQSGTQAAVASAQSGATQINSAMVDQLTKGLSDIKSVAAEIAPAIAKEIQANTQAVTAAMGKVEDEIRSSGDRMVSTSKEVGTEIVNALGTGFGGLQNTLNKLDGDFQKFFDKLSQQAAANGAEAGKAYNDNFGKNAGPGGGGGGGTAGAPFTGGQSVGMGNAKDIQAAVFGHKMQTAADFKGAASDSFLAGRMGIAGGGDSAGGSVGNFLQGRGNYYDPQASKPQQINLNIDGKRLAEVSLDGQGNQLKSKIGVGGFK